MKRCGCCAPDDYGDGAVCGAGIGGLGTIEEQYGEYLKAGSPRKISPFFVPATIVNMISGHLSIKYGLKGPNLGIVTACTTSTHAIGLAADGERAWTLLRESNPDVVVLDWVMQGMSGIALAKMIRTNPMAPNPFVPVIMLSGYGSLEHVEQARDAGVNEFLAKPVSVKAILSRLISVIEHPRPYVRTKGYFGPCRRRHARDEYRGPERRSNDNATAIDTAQEQMDA